jgi:hypothetical protein
MTPRLWWALATLPLLLLFAVGYVLRLVFGSIAAASTFVVQNLRWLAIPFAYSLKRAQGFQRIHAAWVKPSQPNRRAADRVTYVKRRGGWREP